MEADMEREVVSHRAGRTSQEQETMFESEHWLSWFFMVAAIVLGVIGMLRGFGLIGGPASSDAAAGTVAGFFGTTWDSVTWMLPAIASAMLSMALHQTDHHRMREPEHLDDREEGLWQFEHGASWLMTILTVVLGVVGMLVGFHVLGGGNHQPDGLPWLLGSIGTGVLTNTLHGVRHHQLASDADYIVRLVEERVGAPRPLGERGTVERSAIREPRM
jgi:heme/copper-type cytochrome/quinol oxidase subunit 2